MMRSTVSVRVLSAPMTVSPTPGSRYRSVLATIGLRLESEHPPQITEPDQWTRHLHDAVPRRP